MQSLALQDSVHIHHRKATFSLLTENLILKGGANSMICDITNHVRNSGPTKIDFKVKDTSCNMGEICLIMF